MQTCPHENGDGEWQDHPYVLWKSAKKGLILRNTGFIITGPTVCLFVEGRQVIEEFINQFMVFSRGFCVGRVSGRRPCPKTEVFQYLPYYLLVSDKADDLHLPTTLRATERISLIDFFDTLAKMETEFREGDIIVINPYLKPEHNDYVVIANDEGEATFKQLKKYGKTRVLHPLNPKYDDMELNKDIEYKIVGVVMEKKKRYR